MLRRGASDPGNLQSLLNLIEQRFDLRLSSQAPDHLRLVCTHYDEKRRLLLRQFGEAAINQQDYAKAVLISETTRLILHEIDPRPRRKLRKKKNDRR
jgi:hypothetical protein